MRKDRLLGLAIGLLALTAPAAWDSKFFFAGRLKLTPGTNTSIQLKAMSSGQVLSGQYVKVTCHDDAGVPNPVDAYVGVGRSDGGMGIGTGPCLQTDGGLACDLVRYSMGEKFYSQQLSTEDTVWALGIDAGVCEAFVAGN